MRLHDQIVRVRAELVQDPYTGDQTRAWDAPALSGALPAEVQPAGRTELLDRRQVTISTWTVFTYPADIVATDRIRWRGEDYEVDGEVGAWMRHGHVHHLEFTIKRISS